MLLRGGSPKYLFIYNSCIVISVSSPNTENLGRLVGYSLIFYEKKCSASRNDEGLSSAIQ